MPRPSLLRGVGFALVAALGAIPWWLVVGSWLGDAAAVSSYWLILVVAQPVFVSTRLRRGLVAACVAAALTLIAALFAPAPESAALVVPVVLGVVRSGILYPRPLARALWLEVAFTVAGVFPALWFYDDSAFGLAFASWAYWLVQAAFALTSDGGRQEAPRVDPFTSAHTAAIQVLEQPRPR